MKKYTRKQVQRGWAFYDWANSAFALVVTAAVFPFYYSSQIDNSFELAGRSFTDDSVLSYSISVAYVFLVVALPILSGIADVRGFRLRFWKIFTYVGGVACMSLFFFEGHDKLWLAVTAYALANIGFGGSLVFYNSFLPRIAKPSEMDRLSSRGFVLGYIGSVLLLVVCLFLIQKAPDFGWEDATLAPRLSFLLVGIWWIAWAFRSFRRMPAETSRQSEENALLHGWHELRKVLGKLKRMVYAKRFLISFLFYNAGVQTILFLAGTFAEKELSFEASELIQLILILQLFGAVGAFAFARLSERWGNKLVLMLLVSLWLGICILAFLTHVKWKFYVLSSLVGVTMGGIQALSRATYAKLIDDQEDEFASFFSLYNVVYYLSIILGTLSFGLISQSFGSMRYSILGLSLFFFLGLGGLMTFRMSPQTSSSGTTTVDSK